MPLNVYAESYINFGYLGLVLFPFIIILLLLPYFIILNLLKLNSMLNILVLAHFIFNFQSNLSLSFGYMYITLMLIVIIQFFSKEKSNAKKIIFESIKYLIYRILFENKKSLKEPLKSITKNIKISYYEGHTRVTYEKKYYN